MGDSIGRISVPTPTASGLTFPLVSDFGYGISRPFPIIEHHFGERAALTTQRFQVGIGPRRFAFKRAKLNYSSRTALLAFFEQVQGAFQSFTYNAPQADKSTIPYSVLFETAPLSITELVNACQAGFNFVESFDPSQAPTYPVNATCLRFPSETLKTALLSQVQQIIPLVHIRVRETEVPDIYLADRRCTIGGQLYLPRVLDLGEPGSNVIVSQNINGAADNVQFSLGNADRVMTDLSNDTDLKFATIDLSLFHVQSGILLQLWKGFVINFVNDGNPSFTLQCSDGLYQITQQYPARTVSRTCWKTFNDGLNCPYASEGHGGDPVTCDYYFDSANGCQAHGMDRFFGGHPAQPQGVNIKDNSTGTWGIGRNTVTATSIISDTSFGNAMQEIWCNDEGDAGKIMPVAAMVIAGRDESDFFDALGILGAGPITEFAGMTVFQNADGFRYIIAPLLDGQPPHGFKTNSDLTIRQNSDLGLRQIAGNDPQDESFSLGQGTPQVWGPQRAAGTAFVEIRRTDQPGVQPSLTDSHSMQVPISKGLAGWTWSPDGTRTLTPGLYNPFWIAVNSLLRCLGLFGADSATQLKSFVLPSLNVGDGTGTGEIADYIVDKLVGSGTERQFRFQGVIGQQKPFRDWLTEILSCGLGYYTWEFAKLKFGCRENASAVEAFTIGNILFQSLTLQPIEATFERLVIDFADQAYQYQGNIAEYSDKDHAAYYGRAGNPLTSKMHSVGGSSLSQMLRVAATRTREETGGVNATEWRNARNASWKSTILALNTEVGQVVSMTHPDMPGGVGKFRIQTWRLMKDWSIEIQAKTVTDSMYDLDVGPKPIDVVPDALPALFYPIPFAPAWAPFQVQAPSDDALFPDEWNFDSDQEYTTLADGTAGAALIVTGKLPVNDFIPGCGAPVIGSISQSASGGAIPGDTGYRVTICANDANGLPSPPALIVVVNVPAGSGANSITLGDLVWPKVSGLVSYTVFVSDRDDLICGQQTGSLADSGGHVYTPGFVVITGPFARSTYALPSPYVSKIRLKAKLELHGGIAGAGVTSVDTSTIVCSDMIDSGLVWDAADLVWDDVETLWDDLPGPLDPVGRILSVIGRPSGSTPFRSYLITAFDPATGTFTVSPDPNGTVLPLDAIVIRNLGSDNSEDPTSIEDLGYQNVTNGYAGLGLGEDGLGADRGNILRVIQGLGRDQLRKITLNTMTKLTWDKPLVLDPTSVWIVESPDYPYSADSTAIDNADPTKAVTFSIPAENYLQQPMVIAGFTVDVNGVESPDGDCPIREDWIFGDSGFTAGGVEYI